MTVYNWMFLTILSVFIQSNVFAQEQPLYRTKNLSTLKTSGALLFKSKEDVRACFGKVLLAKGEQGFQLCEGNTTAIIQAGTAIEILQKIDTDKVALVKILEGKETGKTGFIHETWLDPSPWAKQWRKMSNRSLHLKNGS
jgi:hypothetical protein